MDTHLPLAVLPVAIIRLLSTRAVTILQALAVLLLPGHTVAIPRDLTTRGLLKVIHRTAHIPRHTKQVTANRRQDHLEHMATLLLTLALLTLVHTEHHPARLAHMAHLHRQLPRSDTSPTKRHKAISGRRQTRYAKP